MKSPVLLSATLIATMMIGVGCNDSRTSDYPNATPETARLVDDVKRNARDQKDAIDKSYDEVVQNVDFRERQIHERYKADRATHQIDVEKETALRTNKRRDAETKAKVDKDKIDAETTTRLVDAPADQVAQIRAEALAKKADIDRALVTTVAPFQTDMERNDVRISQRKAELDLKEVREVSELEKERSKAREDMKLKRIAVDRWTTDELAKVNKASPQPKM